ncbi:MAG: GNAT family N-acetyltransferase [Pseudomonadota bacterium]
MVPSAAELTARVLDRGTLDEVLDLSLKPGQEAHVAHNAVSVAQAAYEPFCWIRGLFAGNRAVGLISMIDLDPVHPDASPDDPEDAAYLWRFMIAAEHQGRGLGTAAMGLAFAQARRWGRAQLCVDVSEGPGNPGPFYRRFGLAPTEWVNDGERMFLGPVPPMHL